MDGERAQIQILLVSGLAMKVRTKAFVIIALTFVVMMLVCVLFFQKVIFQGFLDIEQQQARADVERVGNVLDKEFGDLQKICGDWASWDATYAFINDLNHEYISGNLNVASFETLDVDMMIFIDPNGIIRFFKACDLAAEEELNLPAYVSGVFKKGTFQAWYTKTLDPHQGFVRIGQKLLFFAARSILDSNEEQPPRGILLVGRFFDSSQVQAMGKTLELPLQGIHANEQGIFPGILPSLAAELEQHKSLVRNVNAQHALGYVLVRDIFNRPAVLLEAELARAVSMQGQRAIWYVIAFFVLTSLIFLLVVLLLLDRSILQRLNLIIDHVREIAAQKDISTRLPVDGVDELGGLAMNLNAMLGSLEQEQQKRERAEAEQAMLTNVIEQLEEDVVVMDAHGAIVYGNAAFRRGGCGYSENACLEGLFDDPRQAQQARLAVESGTVWNERCRHVHHDGEVVVCDTMMAPVAGKDDTLVYVCIRRDISEKVEIEKRLQLSRKMESLGSLAGGIAHDFNNILTAIAGFTQLVGFDVDKAARSQGYLSQILLAVQRAKNLIGNILTFSAQGEDHGPRASLDISGVVLEAFNLVRASLPSSITIEQDIRKDVGTVQADSGQIHQIVINLCTNAGHAMKRGGGILTVCVRATSSEDMHTYHLAEMYADSICLQIGDTGSGMTPEVRERVFDPFFTTKGPGEGTGMGLAVVHSIVTRMGGILHVHSEPGEGSVFTLFFPGYTGEAQTSGSCPSPKNIPGRERILMVDDEQDVVYVAGEMLELLGYKVTTVTNSRDALHTFMDNPEKFDILITDLTMPLMDGNELIKRIHEVRRDIPALLCSGYIASLAPENIHSKGSIRILRKPYTSQELTREIQELLHGHFKE